MTPVVGVGGVVFDEDRERVLLIKRGRPPRKGQWSIPGGKLAAGESLVHAVAREILEETGLVVRVGPLVEVVELMSENFHYVVLDYLCQWEGGEVKAGDDAADAAFIPLGDLPMMNLTDAVRRVIDKALELAQKGL
ncbi:MAG: NUDIX domain-containing protein [Polyangiaceae bacterium]|nr:NUDIX domain-containing protein [Polyangiaceae bacterium]